MYIYIYAKKQTKILYISIMMDAKRCDIYYGASLNRGTFFHPSSLKFARKN